VTVTSDMKEPELRTLRREITMVSNALQTALDYQLTIPAIINTTEYDHLLAATVLNLSNNPGPKGLPVDIAIQLRRERQLLVKAIKRYFGLVEQCRARLKVSN